MKKIFLLLVLIISLAITNVAAKDDKTITIELPSNQLRNAIAATGYMTIRQVYAFNVLDLPDDNDLYSDEFVIYNQKGKPIIKEYKSGPSTPARYELLDGVTEKDCIFEITDEMRNKEVNGYKVKEILKGYDKIQLIVKKMESKTIDEVYVIDLTKNNSLNTNFLDGLALQMLLSYGNIENHSIKYAVSNTNGKELISISGFIKTINNETTEELEKITISEDTTYKDDIIIELTPEEIDSLHSYDVDANLNNYSRLIIKFSDKEYLDSDYVIDVKSLNKNNLNEIYPYLSYLENKKGWIKTNYYYYIKNSKNETVVECEIIGFLSLIANPMPNVTYNDNLVIDLNDAFKEFLKDEVFEKKDYKQIIIKLKDPEFIEGQKQTYYQNNKEDISFDLTVSKEELEEKGSIYIDKKLLDKNNYTLTSNTKGVTITIKKEYLDTLDSGVHKIIVKALYGETSTSFTIKEKKEKNIINPDTEDKILIIIALIFINLGLVSIINKNKGSKYTV